MILAGALTLLLSWTCLYMYRYRCYITKYTAIIGTLASSMTFGFLIGAASSLNLEAISNKLTILLILAGMLIGSLNSLATITAGIAGSLTSGFAGNIVVSLMPIGNSESFLLALMLTFISFHFVFLYLVVSEIPRNYHVVFRRIIQNPYIAGIALIVIFYLYQLIEPLLIGKGSSQT